MKIIYDTYMVVDCSMHGLVQLVGLMGNPNEVSSLSLRITQYMCIWSLLKGGYTKCPWFEEVFNHKK